MAIEIGNVTLETIFIFIAIAIATFVLSSLVNMGIRRILDRRVKRSTSKLTARVTQYAVIVIGLYVGTVVVLGLDLTALFASLGLIALAVTFASQQIIQNTMAGILIFIQRPIKLEEWVEIGTLPQTGVGRVKDIALTRTTLRNADGRIVYIPNSMLITSKVINYSRAGFTEIPFSLSFPLGTNMERAKEIIMKAVEANPRIPPNLALEEERSFFKSLELPQIGRLFDTQPDMSMFMPRILVTGISDSEVTVEVRIWVREIQNKDEIVSQLLEHIYYLISKEDLVLA